MVRPTFPERLFPVGCEPQPTKSINYYSGDTRLLNALTEMLRPDEQEELLKSRLGVFLKFHNMAFGWASRLVHHLLTFQLQCKKTSELWFLIGVHPIRFSLNEFQFLTGLNCDYVEDLESPPTAVTPAFQEFWKLLGVPEDRGPSYDELLAAASNCEEWTRESRIRLGYLSIFASFIDARKPEQATRLSLARLVMDTAAFESYPWGRVAFKTLVDSVKRTPPRSKSYSIEGFIQVLQVWVYYALPDFAANYTELVADSPSPPLLAYKGSRNRKNPRDNMIIQTRVRSCIELKYEDMFPRWDNEVEDAQIDNIVQALCGRLGRKWKFTLADWKIDGALAVKEEEVVKSGGSKRVRDEPDQDLDSHKRCKESASSDMSENRSLVTMKEFMDECCKRLLSEVMTGISCSERRMMEGVRICQEGINTLSERVSGVERSLEEIRSASASKEQVKSNPVPVPEANLPVGVSTKPSTSVMRVYGLRKSKKVTK